MSVAPVFFVPAKKDVDFVKNRIFIDFRVISIDFHSFLVISLDFNRFRWICMVLKGLRPWRSENLGRPGATWGALGQPGAARHRV